MRKQKYISTLILLILLFIPIYETEIAFASEDQPPILEHGQRLDQDVVDPTLLEANRNDMPDGDMSYMTGIDPNSGSLINSQTVDVVIPAVDVSSEHTATSAVPASNRPEITYEIERSIRLVPGPKVLLLEADIDTLTYSPILSLLRMYGDISNVDMFDAAASKPMINQLLPYDVVVSWSNMAYNDPVGIGDVLADYVDAGGKVVNLMFSMGAHGWNMQGRFMSEGYTAMNGTDILYNTRCMNSSNPSHPIMFGIDEVCDHFTLDDTYLTLGSSSVAQWDNGELFVAAKNDRSVVTINGYVGEGFMWTGQMPDVLHNAILWLVSDGGCNTQLYDNGPIVTDIGAGYNSANVSQLQTSLSMNTLGFGVQYDLGYRMADDFTVTSPEGWHVNQLTVFSYQSGTFTYPPSSTTTGVYYQIWDGPPDDPSSTVVFGDLSTNQLLESSWTQTYRANDSDLLINLRPIMANVVSADVFLPPGTYWLDWSIDGTDSYSGPWVPPITILGSTATGNAKQFTTTWASALDSGTSTQQGMPFLIQGCKEEGVWEEIHTNPVQLMDNVLAAFDNKIWSITGFGATSEVSSYDPNTGIWTIIPGSTPPFGVNYARSGCQVDSMVYIYGDTTTPGFEGLWRYDILANTWTQLTPGNPGNGPTTTGIWAPAWVLDSSTNRCYLTGGATIPGNGDLNTVFVYNPSTNQWMAPLPNFTSIRDFHAAFIFTRPTDSHKLLCVAGGIATGSVVRNTTQCYDFTTASWNAENADLGSLPQPIWGSGYAQTRGVNGLNMWIVNGADDSFALNNNTWVYDLHQQSWKNIGPLESGFYFRTSAVTLNGKVYHVGGSPGGFSPTGKSDRYNGYMIYLPMILK